MKSRYIVFAVVGALVLVPMISASFAEQIKVKFGETVSYEHLKFYFYDIEDSRCPSDVTCIWEGKVLAMIRISNATLDIGGSRNIGNVEKSFPPYVITLTDIQPYPISTEKPDYVATLEIEKQNPKPSDFRDLQTGETISNPEVVMMIQSLGAGLIILFIVIYAIKKKKRK
ncbi:MAG: hypothetical protein K5790_05365 [Nitrosopumilus sp.]|uniref:hypothetical protein n=1 Tax=Nitrosopumilus sp. TaxID=2024843 RepID=UPI00247CEECD|nr:hypothetical protein [Nitrosopumilus sp.]MCV0392708.1 hypothetical protein [Nitrosopumilus sp.]